MKYSQLIGIALALALIGLCFVPWTFIPSKSITVYGLSAEGTNFGKPGLMNLILSVVALALFAIPKIWSKRINVFICTFSFAWALRNYIILTACFLGECPEKLWGIYALIACTFLMLLMSLFPKLKVA